MASMVTILVMWLLGIGYCLAIEAFLDLYDYHHSPNKNQFHLMVRKIYVGMFWKWTMSLFIDFSALLQMLKCRVWLASALQIWGLFQNLPEYTFIVAPLLQSTFGSSFHYATAHQDTVHKPADPRAFTFLKLYLFPDRWYLSFGNRK